MKRSLAIFLIITFVFTHGLYPQVKFPSSSPVQTIKQEFALGTIELTYSRPSTGGRRVFGDIVPYGKLWRTGGNTTAKLSFSEPIEIYGRKLDSGAYALYMIPGLESWEIIINKGTKNTGTDGYKESEDVIRFKVDPIKTKTRTESLSLQFANIKPESCELHVMWEKKLIVIPISANIKEKIRAQIDAAMLTDKKPYWQAAQFYNEYDLNFNKALDNVNKATENNPKAYWMFLYKAKIQRELGDNAGAIISSRISLELSKEANNDDYVKMGEKMIADAKAAKK